MMMPFLRVCLNFNLSLLFFLRVSRLGVYTIIIAGWSSNSSYSLLGGLRSVAQTISYEVRLALIIISFIFLSLSFNLLDYYYVQNYG
ncbi:NADH-quinone oxidoreductase subunit H, partial [Enterobacter cloacae complex sp. 2DZ2F20B]